MRAHRSFAKSGQHQRSSGRNRKQRGLASRDEGAPNDRAEIWAIYVKPAFWSTGAGRLLWLEALQRIVAEGYKSVSLWVIAGNERAVRFCERAGFVVEPESRKSFELGGTTLEELRYVRHAG